MINVKLKSINFNFSHVIIESNSSFSTKSSSVYNIADEKITVFFKHRIAFELNRSKRIYPTGKYLFLFLLLFFFSSIKNCVQHSSGF